MCAAKCSGITSVIRFPTQEEILIYKAMISRKYKYVPNVWAAMDGLQLSIEIPTVNRSMWEEAINLDFATASDLAKFSACNVLSEHTFMYHCIVILTIRVRMLHVANWQSICKCHIHDISCQRARGSPKLAQLCFVCFRRAPHTHFLAVWFCGVPRFTPASTW